MNLSKRTQKQRAYDARRRALRAGAVTTTRERRAYKLVEVRIGTWGWVRKTGDEKAYAAKRRVRSRLARASRKANRRRAGR